jgi:hypothetical protein
VHGVLLFFERVRHPRDDYDVFVAWARRLGYDRLGRDVPENDLPAILDTYRAGVWPGENRFSIRELKEWGRLDPAWIKVAKSLPTAEEAASGNFVRLTELVEIRDARVSRRALDPARDRVEAAFGGSPDFRPDAFRSH